MNATGAANISAKAVARVTLAGVRVDHAAHSLHYASTVEVEATAAAQTGDRGARRAESRTEPARMQQGGDSTAQRALCTGCAVM
jgi:hypothetical protein